MRARYLTPSEKTQIMPQFDCKNCKQADWPIRVQRDGGKSDFIICEYCGHHILTIGQLDSIQLKHGRFNQEAKK